MLETQELGLPDREEMVNRLVVINKAFDDQLKQILVDNQDLPPPMIMAAALRSAAFGLAVVGVTAKLESDQLQSLWMVLAVKASEDQLSDENIRAMKNTLKAADLELVNRAVNNAIKGA